MRFASILAPCLFLLISCASPPPPQTLYSKLGGLGTIENIANAFIHELSRNDDVYPFFEHSSIERFRGHFIAQICRVSEGPCGNSASPVLYIHTSPEARDIIFNGEINVLINAMSTVGVSHMLQKILLKRLVPIQTDIVYVFR
jgi:hemoglobin